jgi:hypothetical protein
MQTITATFEDGVLKWFPGMNAGSNRNKPGEPGCPASLTRSRQHGLPCLFLLDPAFMPGTNAPNPTEGK